MATGDQTNKIVCEVCGVWTAHQPSGWDPVCFDCFAAGQELFRRDETPVLWPVRQYRVYWVDARGICHLYNKLDKTWPELLTFIKDRIYYPAHGGNWIRVTLIKERQRWTPSED